MEFFLDTADVDEIREIAAWGILDGVTTNPSLIKKSGRDFKEVVREIANICSGPISAEVTAMDTAGMLEQARQLKSELPENVIIKIPCTPEGLAATKVLTDEGIDTNVTLIFSTSQALMAAKAGATYVSPFIGRIDDTGHDGMNLIAEIMETWSKYDITTKVLAASIRHPTHMLQCMQLGAHTATMPAKIFKQLMTHPLTDRGLEGFMRDWAEVEAAGNA
ncbi:fructose-6-phosphate aldolase [Candidatus Poseidoniales archaeon]|nr:fructose-6-phosphate aldolase [Candidatus Poseidoniales archaeon]MDA8717587.1 fructose-6-phosphate aldolase [Candidatus Poseidoniales archaeon]MDB2348264.1 fructose-6-phosphate aldolase [Candidatus Poseidoniales archaeon]MDB2367198.1 fructose-6-phosphate aldolase [Candidatus Poseidoniales archaeon]|tara:strand:+ start:3441 stop:4100 length:660 start_codon:yes stop_codon:yes gene_type:complete